MIEGWLDQAATDFWTQIGRELPFPRNLEMVVSRGLPINHIALPNLNVKRIEQWFLERQAPYQLLCQNRALYGCIVAMRGHGFLFVDQSDSEAERRFTIAHEIAHFLLDYVTPRQKVLDVFGDSIRPVLDGERTPTRLELIDAMLSKVNFGVYVDMMPRSAQGGIDQGAILCAEDNADQLAFELLAPAEHVLNQPAVLQTKLPFARTRVIASLLMTEYGLPKQLAFRYSAFLTRHTPQQSSAQWLGL